MPAATGKLVRGFRQFGAALSEWREDMAVRSRETWTETKQTIDTHVKTAPRRLLGWGRDSFNFYRKDTTALRMELVSGFTIAILQIPER